MKRHIYLDIPWQNFTFCVGGGGGTGIKNNLKRDETKASIYPYSSKCEGLQLSVEFEVGGEIVLPLLPEFYIYSQDRFHIDRQQKDILKTFRSQNICSLKIYSEKTFHS